MSPCKKVRFRDGSGLSGGRKTLLEKSLAELSRPQTTEGKEAPSFPATRASEMTPLMTDRATFLPESSPVRHASLCRKRPLAFFDKLRRRAKPAASACFFQGKDQVEVGVRSLLCEEEFRSIQVSPLLYRLGNGHVPRLEGVVRKALLGNGVQHAAFHP